MPDNSEHLIDFAAYCEKLAKDTDPDDADHEADALLLTCMDFRFFIKIAEMMKGIKYDHVILAGAALGVVVENPRCLPDKARWQHTFFDHLELAIALHKIRKVIVLEHRECGAYGPNGFCVLPENPGRDEERLAHEAKVEELKAKIHEIDPDLYFCSFLMEVPDPDAVTFDQLVCAD